MGTIACREARRIFENALWVLSNEIVSAAQAQDFHAPLRPGKGVAAVHAAIRKNIPRLARDRYLKPEVNKMRELIRCGELVRVAREAAVPPPLLAVLDIIPLAIYAPSKKNKGCGGNRS
jgi:histidine ammonia-lyase